MQQAQNLFGHAFQGKQRFGITTFFFFSYIINALYKSRHSVAADGAVLLQWLGIHETEELHSVVEINCTSPPCNPSEQKVSS